jgi:hypothetical protein
MSQTSSSGIGYAFKEGALSTLPKFVQKIIGTDSKQGKLYDAIVNGDTAYIERLKSGYKDDKAYETAVRKALRENDSLSVKLPRLVSVVTLQSILVLLGKLRQKASSLKIRL